MFHRAAGNASGQPSNFDSYSFRKYMNITGWPYRNQAMELIDLCLWFSKAAEQTFTQDAELSELLRVCDQALLSVAHVREKNEASSEDIERAIEALEKSDIDFLHYRQWNLINGFQNVMENAKEKDKDKPENIKRSKDKSFKVIEFQIIKRHRHQPAIVRQALKNDAKLREVLWNFIRLDAERRLILSENPHFYGQFPTLPNANWGAFPIRAIEENWHTYFPEPIRVFTNILGRVFLERRQPPRAFEVLDMNATFIYKSVCGELWGEVSVKDTVLQSNRDSWFHVELLPSQPGVGATVDPPISGTPLVNSPACVPVIGWNHALRAALRTPNIKIRVIACTEPIRGCTRSN